MHVFLPVMKPLAITLKTPNGGQSMWRRAGVSHCCGGLTLQRRSADPAAVRHRNGGLTMLAVCPSGWMPAE